MDEDIHMILIPELVNNVLLACWHNPNHVEPVSGKRCIEKPSRGSLKQITYEGRAER